MASYDLTGSGVQGLSPGVTHLFIDVTVFGQGFSTGRAVPTNYVKLGAFRLQRQGASYPPIWLDAQHQVIDITPGVSGIGYSLSTQTIVHVIEDFTVP